MFRNVQRDLSDGRPGSDSELFLLLLCQNHVLRLRTPVEYLSALLVDTLDSIFTGKHAARECDVGLGSRIGNRYERSHSGDFIGNFETSGREGAVTPFLIRWILAGRAVGHL